MVLLEGDVVKLEIGGSGLLIELGIIADSVGGD